MRDLTVCAVPRDQPDLHALARAILAIAAEQSAGTAMGVAPGDAGLLQDAADEAGIAPCRRRANTDPLTPIEC